MNECDGCNGIQWNESMEGHMERVGEPKHESVVEERKRMISFVVSETEAHSLHVSKQHKGTFEIKSRVE